MDNGDTIYVDASYTGADANGTDASPFSNVMDAYLSANPEDQIAIAAGEYIERLNITKPVHLVGRCAAMVNIRGQSIPLTDYPPVTIRAAGSGSTVSGVSLTGVVNGLIIQGATGVLIDEVRVFETGLIGLSVIDGGEATVHHCQIEDCQFGGLAAINGQLTVTDSEIRGTIPDANGGGGHGVAARCGIDGMACGDLLLQHSVVSSTMDIGVFITEASARIVDTVIRDTLGDLTSGPSAILTQCVLPEGECPTTEISGCWLSGNVLDGITSLGSPVEISDTVVRDSLDDPWGPPSDSLGRGLYAQCIPGTGICGRMTVTRSVVTGHLGKGIGTYCAPVTIFQSIVAHNNAGTHGYGGYALTAFCPDALSEIAISVTQSLIHNNQEAGLLFEGVKATVEQSVVSDTRIRAVPGEDGTWGGSGIQTECADHAAACGSLLVQDSIVSGNTWGGVESNGVPLIVRRSLVKDTQPAPDDSGGGQGVVAICDTRFGVCASLELSHSVIQDNHGDGLYLRGVLGVVEETTIRHTHIAPGSEMSTNVVLVCDGNDFPCHETVISRSLLEGAEGIGVLVRNASLDMTDSVVRANAMNALEEGGRGIEMACNEWSVQ